MVARGKKRRREGEREGTKGQKGRVREGKNIKGVNGG